MVRDMVFRAQNWSREFLHVSFSGFFPLFLLYGLFGVCESSKVNLSRYMTTAAQCKSRNIVYK